MQIVYDDVISGRNVRSIDCYVVENFEIATSSSFRDYPKIYFLPLDKAVASREVNVIVSGSDGETETLWSQLANSETVRDRPYVSIGS